MAETEFSYDKKYDTLYLYRKGSIAKGSINIGDIILDISHDGKVVGVEILNATEFFKPIEIKTSLENIVKAGFMVVYKPDAIYVNILLLLPEKIEKSMMLPIPVKVIES